MGYTSWQSHLFFKKVMSVDGVGHDDAAKVVAELSRHARAGAIFYELPYNLIIAGSVGAAIASFPMVRLSRWSTP